MGKKLTTEEFIKKAKLVHGENTYNYSESAYVNAKSKLKIFCNKCEKYFEQVASTHYECGCPTCGKEKQFNSRRKGDEKFISDAISKHGLKFDYSLLKYKNNRTKVDIICPTHGLIQILPNGHLSSETGCFYCGVDSRKLSTKEFIEKCNLKHNNIYDYSKTNYIDSDTKVEVICKEHGSFWINPRFHLEKGKCPQCSEHFPYTTETFIEKAISIHQDKYDYSKVFYKNFETKVEIVCPNHGTFLQSPQNHIGYNKRGCPKCSKSGTKLTTQEFIDKANLLHNNFYDYSNTNYIKSSQKVDIICPKHGNFSITPNSHLGIRRGGGCIKCYRERQTGTFEDFLKNAIATHGDKYEYHFSDYEGSKSKIKIFCKKHQSYFIQSSTRHTQGQNCPLCANEVRSKSQQNCANNWKPYEWEHRGKMSKNFTGFKVYIIECWNNDEIFYKIGKTYVNIDKRFPSKITMPYNYKILKIFEGSANEMSNLEYKLQKSNKINKYIPNIDFNGKHECYTNLIEL